MCAKFEILWSSFDRVMIFCQLFLRLFSKRFLDKILSLAKDLLRMDRVVKSLVNLVTGCFLDDTKFNRNLSI